MFVSYSSASAVGDVSTRDREAREPRGWVERLVLLGTGGRWSVSGGDTTGTGCDWGALNWIPTYSTFSLATLALTILRVKIIQV